MPDTASVEFFSRQFRPVKQPDGGDDAVQEGLYGVALASAIKQRLAKRGVTLEPLFAEDWGYCARVAGLPFALHLGFSSQKTDEPGLYRCTIKLFPMSAGWLQRRRHLPVEQEAARIRQVVEEVVAADPELTRVSWQDPT